VNNGQRIDPVSLLTAAIVAMHGKYRSTKIMKENAINGVNNGFPALGPLVAF